MQELLLDTAREWFVKIHPSLECLIAEQTTVPPAPQFDNYGVLSVVGMRRQGIDGSELKYDEELDKFRETVFSVKEITLSLDVFTVDNTAEDIINKALVSLVSQGINDIFTYQGFSVLRYEESRNLSSVISARYSRRFQSDITFCVNVVYESLINRVATVPYRGVIDETTIITGEVTNP
jgi:hypothetical protein